MNRYRYLLLRHSRKFKSIGNGLLILLCLFLMLGTFLYGADPYDNRIVDGVRVGGLDLSGQTLEEAHRSLKNQSSRILEGTDLILELPEETISLSPADTGVKLRCWSAVLDAWKVGRFSDQDADIGLLPYLRLDEAYIQSALQRYAEQHNTDLTPSHYELTGPTPDLEIESNSSSTQTLELTLGLPQARLDETASLEKILSSYDNAFAGNYSVSDFQVRILQQPQKPDLNAIYEDVSILPVDDTIDLDTYDVVPGAWGYHFDLEEAKKLVAAAKWGETISLPMVFQQPEIYGDKVYFRDVLGYCETKHTNDENRNNNLRQACQAMDGLILQPGDVFSYNGTLGPRTKENGYLRAGAYSGWELVQSYGGGICQGSTTIYGAALYADLEILHRRNHGYLVGYAQPGLDATVNWGGPDFQFRNSTHFPIKIAAEVSDGFVKVTILGTEERDYYIEMESEAQWGSSTVYARSYKCKYDRQTGELISRELEAKSNYMR